ncbi:MAG: glutamate--tRNA ligase [Candidatus Tyrphobacter sp.]
MKARTRVAPSPTGDPHVATAYAALVNLCVARGASGAFVLRIEDTDRTRSEAPFEAAIFESLRWLHLEWDEGPDVGGPHAPYRQSERSAIYAEHAERLLAGGHAFRCYCSPQRLEEMRVAQRAAHEPPHYDGSCLRLSEADVAAHERAGDPSVVRLRVPDEGSCVFEDVLRGRIEVEWKSVDMQVLVKSDGFPTYHLANVVDDHLMEITDVVRGEEWISSTPKHVLLYRAFGWERTMPRFCHLPLLRNPDKSKLSKRRNPTSILHYRARGILPEALLHFLASLVDARNDEALLTCTSCDEMIARMVGNFDLGAIALGGPVFDLEKLLWLNGQHLRRHTVAQFVEILDGWGYTWPETIPPQHRERIAQLAMSRIGALDEFAGLVAFFAHRPDVSKADLELPKQPAAVSKEALERALAELPVIDAWHAARIGETLKKAVADAWPSGSVRFRDVVRAYYVAVTGSPTSIPLFDAMELLGKNESLKRLEIAVERLH